MMRRAAIFLATGAFSGLSPLAPGTAGSLCAFVVLLWVPSYASLAFAAWTAGLLIAGVWAAAEAERHYRQDDAQQIVIDEIAGMLVSVLLLPATIKTAVAAFVFFRIFDIWKPFPVRQAERISVLFGRTGMSLPGLFRLSGGMGVMLDDVVAGIYANLCIRLLYFFSVM